MPFENESNVDDSFSDEPEGNLRVASPPKKITIAWLFLVVLTVSVSFAGSEVVRENFPAQYATLMVWAEFSFLLGCMFLISWVANLPFFAKETPDEPSVQRTGQFDDWTLFIGIWLLLPLLAIWTDIFTRTGIHNGG